MYSAGARGTIHDLDNLQVHCNGDKLTDQKGFSRDIAIYLVSAGTHHVCAWCVGKVGSRVDEIRLLLGELRVK